jgi:hypothetical protein
MLAHPFLQNSTKPFMVKFTKRRPLYWVKSQMPLSATAHPQEGSGFAAAELRPPYLPSESPLPPPPPLTLKRGAVAPPEAAAEIHLKNFTKNTPHHN